MSSTETLERPPAALHHRLGARMATYRGVEAPAAFAGEAEEHAALLGGCGLTDRSWMERIAMMGEDRARFLGGLVTCDVQNLEPGGGVRGFVTDVKGRVLADPVVLAHDDRFSLVLPPGTSGAITEHLRKYVIVDRVEVSVVDDAVPLTLAGPIAARVLGAAGELPEDAHGHRYLKVAGVETYVVREPVLAPPDGEVPAWTLWIPAGEAGAVAEHLLDQDQVRPVGFRAWNRLRVEAGRPLFGVDFGPTNFPQETGLEEETVSYTKGCYLGQEVVARIHYRGGVNRHLRGLVVAPGEESADDLVGRALSVDGREAGRVTSATSAGDRGVLGLSILHRRAEPGADVEVEGGGSARVVELPFV